MEAIMNHTKTDVLTIMILKSHLPYIRARAFLKYARSVQSLNINNCNVSNIDPAAFEGLVSLKKLSLSNNKITAVREEWFKDTVYLEQLDLSFNQISKFEPAIFGRLLLLKRFDVRENLLTCLDPFVLPGGIDKVYFSGNPLTFKCRGKLTLWMRDHGVNYRTEQSQKEAWLDKLLWLCAINDEKVAESEDLMKECVILNLFNQLRTGLSTAESYPLQDVSQECVNARNLLTDCIVTDTRKYDTFTNGNVIKNLLLYLYQAKSSI
nr:PREDICTED: TLR4 interactor with leucine rich repeats-like isoform X2 [Megachile rotundata]